MKTRKFDTVTICLGLGFLVGLGVSIQVWIGYAAHEGSMEQIGDALIGVIISIPTFVLGVVFWDRWFRRRREAKDQEGRGTEQPD